MNRYVARRALHAVPVLLGVSVVSFLLIRLVPGDPIRIMLGLRAPESAIEALRARYGFDQPLPVQYLAFLTHALRLEFGDSVVLHTQVSGLVLARLGPSILMVGYSALISLGLAIPFAIISAVNANRLPDHLIRLLTMIAFAMPAFWVGLLLVLLFSLSIKVFPTSGMGGDPVSIVRSLTLPALTIGLYLAPVLARTLRASMIETLRADYVEAARARGLSETRVLVRHVLRTSLIATVTVLGVNVGFLLSGAVVVETVFAIPGLGSLLVTSVVARDFPVVETVTLLFGVAVIVVTLATDLINAALDPRIRL